MWLFVKNTFQKTICQNTLSSQNNDKKSLIGIAWRNQFLLHCGTAYAWQTSLSFAQGNLIVGLNIGRMVAVKIISHLSIYQKLSRIYLRHYFRFTRLQFIIQVFTEDIQNPNEAFDQIIWRNYPKDIFISRHVLEIGVASIAINFNGT